MTREKARKEIHSVFLNYLPFDGDKEADEVIKALEQDTIIIPEGATNGDMIKAMFPNAEYGKDELGNVFVVSDAQLGYIVFRESWWNAPYTLEREV